MSKKNHNLLSLYTPIVVRLIMLVFVVHTVMGTSSIYARGSASLEKSAKDSTQWKKDRVIRGFSVFTSKNSKTDIVPIKVEGIIEAPITAIMENLRTIEGSEDWTPDLVIKKTLKDFGPRKAITYSLTDMPWPLYDRVLILENELLLDKERKLLFVLSKTVPFEKKAIPSSDKTIEALVGYSNMGFRPVSKDKTFVEFTAWVDPKGSIPSWVINFFQMKWPVTFFEALEERCDEYSPELRPGLKTMLDDLLKEMDWDPKTFDS
ncbi:MAG: hypothetical protein CME63_07780 [Halobacteriovoraceae bacterium]|nr:hypothetical protein [Halobacteriovoraceae bacterium]|tara:strand:- start:21142 stop:21930 length:789 start_codon:yes stop_codon:yes gene_type:complete